MILDSYVEWQNVPKCGADIKSGGYDTEELKIPNATCYLVSCKQCKTVLGIIQE